MRRGSVRATSEHGQRRQLETGPQPVSDTSLTLDRHALVLQVRHVTVNRALGHFQALRQMRRRGQATAPDELDDLKQAVGAAHGCFLCIFGLQRP